MNPFSMLLLLCAAAAAAAAYGLTPGSNDVLVRVAKTGADLCCVVKMPGEKYMISQAGNCTGGGLHAAREIQEIIPPGKTIDLLALSHPGSDHLGAPDEIRDTYKVERVLRSGIQRRSGPNAETRPASRITEPSPTPGTSQTVQNAGVDLQPPLSIPPQGDSHPPAGDQAESERRSACLQHDGSS